MLHPALPTGLALVLAASALAQEGSSGAATPAAAKALLAPRTSWSKYDMRPRIESGLAWLARHQDKEGFWSPTRFMQWCAGEKTCADKGSETYRTGLTALAALAFLGYGVIPGRTLLVKDEALGTTPDLGDHVSRALRWLCRGQAADGKIAVAFNSKEMYDHAVATYALVEAFALTGDPEWKEPARKAVDWLVAAQNPGRGWRYTARNGESDTSVTGWCTTALYLARLAGLEVPPSAFQGARNFLVSVTTPESVTGYLTIADAGAKVVLPGKNDDYAFHHTMGAVAVLARHLVEGPKLDARVRLAAAGRIAADPPQWDPAKRTIDYYYWYYATTALHQLSKPSDAAWKAWQKALTDALALGQTRSKLECADGSWGADTAAGFGRWAFEGGRVYSTALAVLALETPIRYEALPPLASLPSPGGGGAAGEVGNEPALVPLTPEERARVEGWVANLGGPAVAAAEAEAAILAFGPRAAEVLRARLRDPDAAVRQKARALLPRLGVDPAAGGTASVDPGALPEYATPHSKHMNRYKEDLRNPDAAVRERAIGALAALKSTWAIEAAVGALAVEDEAGLRERLVDLLREIDRVAVTREVRKAINARQKPAELLHLLEFVERCEESEVQICAAILFLHADAQVSAKAGAALRAHRKTSLAIVVDAARASKGAPRRSLVALLGKIRDKRAVPYLCSLCATEPEVNPDRDAAHGALREIGLPGVPALIDALATTNRKYVAVILRELTNSPYGLDSAEKWKGWVRDNRERIEAVERERFPEDFQ